jgi:tetrahydromethanopterin S-methyltransferase subunit G
MDQTIINWILGLFGMIFGFMLKTVWQAVKDLQTSDKELVEKVNSIEVLVAGHYVKQDEFNRLSDAIFKKLDRIEEKLDKKEDKT